MKKTLRFAYCAVIIVLCTSALMPSAGAFTTPPLVGSTKPASESIVAEETISGNEEETADTAGEAVLEDDTLEESVTGTENAESETSENTEADDSDKTTLQPTPEPLPPQTESVPSEDTESAITLTDLYIFGRRIYLPQYPLIENDTLLVPIKAYMENVTRIEYTDKNGHITIKGEGKTVEMDIGSLTAYQDGTAITLSTAPIIYDGSVYAPMRFICEHFGFEVRAEKSENHLIVKTDVKQNAAESFVNSAGLTSDTPYLIWISKANYTVHVFLGSKGDWDEIFTCPCSIGASSTPTITGTFKFYSLEPRWTYENFYVAPIMRFRGGYAIHSTLLKYDGTDYNATVGAKLSHGCVRVLPKDIAWLTAYIPLQTTIHITEK